MQNESLMVRHSPVNPRRAESPRVSASSGRARSDSHTYNPPHAKKSVPIAKKCNKSETPNHLPHRPDGPYKNKKNGPKNAPGQGYKSYKMLKIQLFRHQKLIFVYKYNKVTKLFVSLYGLDSEKRVWLFVDKAKRLKHR